MRLVQPEVFLVAEPVMDADLDFKRYLSVVGAPAWEGDQSTDAETIVEAAGRLCYRSWLPGLNPNVTKVREDGREYKAAIVGTGNATKVLRTGQRVRLRSATGDVEVLS